jgi:hypothetical protein
MNAPAQTSATPDAGWRVQFQYAGTWWNFTSGVARFDDAWAAMHRAPRSIGELPVAHRIVKTFD